MTSARLLNADVLDHWEEHQLIDCATDGCCNYATEYFEKDGIGSRYCQTCFAKITSMTLEEQS